MEATAKISTPVSNKDYRYNHSQKGRDRWWRYDHSLKGVERTRRNDASEKCLERRERFYAKYGGQAAYKREEYHRIQDEAGCHSAPRDFYPGYRILKALETAEVVEI